MENKKAFVSLDGGYDLGFEAGKKEYRVSLPAGHPRVPLIAATGENGKAVQAPLPVGASEGTGYAAVGGEEYSVTFVKDESLGFHLQYGDVYKLPAGKHESSDPSVLTVDGEGNVTAAALSDGKVSVYGEDGKTVLTVDKVVKAPINLFMITGQSNAYGTYDVPEGRDEGDFYREQKTKTLLPDGGVSLCLDLDIVGNTVGDGIYDLSAGRAGFSPALGRRWYELTGEKTVMLQTAVGGAPVEAWLKPEDGKRFTYTDLRSNFYETTAKGRKIILDMLNAEGSGYELRSVYAFWLQGETGMANTYDPDKDGAGVGNWKFGDLSYILSTDEYYKKLSKVIKDFENDFGSEFFGILLVRGVAEAVSEESRELELYTDLVPPRAAQYALNAGGDDGVRLVSRICDVAHTEAFPDKTAGGIGLMGCNNVHYNQLGHNMNGVAAAESTFWYFRKQEIAPAEVEIIDSDGRKRFEDGETLVMKPGEARALAAAALPLCAHAEKITCVSEDPEVCAVDEYFEVTARADASGRKTALVFTCGGLTKRIPVSVR